MQPWHSRRSVILATLLLFYPLGLIVLLLSHWRKRWKALAAVGFAAVFFVNLHVLFGLRLNFGGAGPIALGFEFFNPDQHERELAAQREGKQSAASASLPESNIIDPRRDWPSFRGSYRDGIVRSGDYQLPWPAEGPRLLWQQPIGGGHASFAIVGGRAYTIEQREDDEAVTCYALENGSELWAYRHPSHFQEIMGGPGPRATPTVEAGRVYALGATGVLNCLDAASGKVFWSRNILSDAGATNLHWAMSASPLVAENRVYLVSGGQGASVMAYEARWGDVLWKSGNHRAGYSSPMLATLQGIEHLLVFDGQAFSAYAPQDGRLLWHYPWQTMQEINVSQPIVLDDQRVFVSSGYGVGCAMLRVTRKESSPESPADAQNLSAVNLTVETVWSNRNLRLKFSSAVLHEGFIYGLDENILTCLEAQTGQRRWRAGRYGYGQILLAGKHLIIQCDNGDLALVEATPQAHKEISRVPALGSKTWNHPAYADGKLLIRNDRQMMCFELR